VGVLPPRLWVGRLDKVMMTRKPHSTEQIVRKPMAADRLLAEGASDILGAAWLLMSQTNITEPRQTERRTRRKRHKRVNLRVNLSDATISEGRELGRWISKP
jgi:hypothetical protein